MIFRKHKIICPRCGGKEIKKRLVFGAVFRLSPDAFKSYRYVCAPCGADPSRAKLEDLPVKIFPEILANGPK